MRSIAVERDREVLRAVSVLVPVVAMQMDRDEVHRCADVAGFELLDHGVAVDPERASPQAQHVEVPGVLDVGALDRRSQGIDPGEGLLIRGHDLAPAPLHAVEPASCGRPRLAWMSVMLYLKPGAMTSYAQLPPLS